MTPRTDSPNSPTAPSGDSFPTSRFPPIPLVRPLEVFGKSFDIELSSGLTLGPDTVLRAAIGKSLQTLLREKKKLTLFKQMQYGLLGQHRLSATTKALVRESVGSMGDQVAAVLNGGAIPPSLDGMSDWACLAATWGPLSRDNVIDVLVNSFVELERFAESVGSCASVHGRDAGEQMMHDRFGQTLPAWRELGADISLEGCLRIESSLFVIVELEACAGTGGKRPSPTSSQMVELLNPKTKPLGNWIRQVASTVKCANNRELADLLSRKAVLHQGKRAITHDTLKSWSAMKPGMLMSLEGCQSLLKVVSDAKASEKLLSRFALARFLAFLCDFMRSTARSEAPSWGEAQRVLLARFQQLSNAKDAADGGTGRESERAPAP